MWFLYALATMLAWGAADLFYKKSVDGGGRFSHVKTSIAVGVVMGAHAIYTLIFKVPDYDFVNLLIYLPVSICYILSMIVGYYGLRYLMVSISSPVQNSSGAVCCLLCLFWLGQTMDALSAVGVIVICVAVVMLGIIEKKQYDKTENTEGKKSIGFIAFLMPIIYCIIDALGTFFDAWYLGDAATTPLVGVTEDTIEAVANVSYELTWLLAAIVLFVVLLVKSQGSMTPKPSAWIAAGLETAGQATYVFAMSGNGIVAAPMIAAYAVVSLLLGRVILKERLAAKQYAAIIAVIIGIVLLGIAESVAA